MSPERLHAVMSGQADDWAGRLFRGSTQLLTPAYGLAAAVHRRLYSLGLKKRHALPRPVISVGNLTAGGTGKTPMVLLLAEALWQMGHRPAILLRGYRATAELGSDEARLYESELGDRVPVQAAAGRLAAGRRVMASHPSVDVFLLDDGFQHHRLARDLDLVLIDATNPFGHEHLLPRGLLRERPWGLKRAQAIVVTRSEQVTDQYLQSLAKRIERYSGGLSPLAYAEHGWAYLNCHGEPDGQAIRPLVDLTRQPIGAITAIGNPQAFWQTLTNWSTAIVHRRTYPDHHAWANASELQAIAQQAHDQGAGALVMTEKDWVKWQPLLDSAQAKLALPVWRPKLQMKIRTPGQEVLRQAIESVFKSALL